jgi:hypothetical protein
MGSSVLFTKKDFLQFQTPASKQPLIDHPAHRLQWRNRLAHGTYRQYLSYAGVVSSSLTWRISFVPLCVCPPKFEKIVLKLKKKGEFDISVALFGPQDLGCALCFTKSNIEGVLASESNFVLLGRFNFTL